MKQIADTLEVSRSNLYEAVKRKNAGGGGIGEILENLKEPLESSEVRLKIANPEFKKVGSDVIEQFKQAIENGYFEPNFVCAMENFEGIRAESEGKGWFLLRSSLHDPVMVLNIESDEDIRNIKSSGEYELFLIGNFKKQFLSDYSIIGDSTYYHNPYVNRMWSEINTYFLEKK